MTSCPCKVSSAAATDESTPPDIATTIRTSGPHPRACKAAQLLDDGRELRYDEIDLCVCIAGAEAQPDGVLCAGGGKPHRAEYVRGLQGPGRARRTSGYRNPLEVQCNQQGLRLHRFEADVRGIGDARLAIAVDGGARYLRQNRLLEAIPQRGR